MRRILAAAVCAVVASFWSSPQPACDAVLRMMERRALAVYPLAIQMIESESLHYVLEPFARFGMKLGFGFQLELYEKQFRKEPGMVQDFIDGLKDMPVALFTDEANEQHYQVETLFFDLALGPRKKYSSALYNLTSVTPPPTTPALIMAELSTAEDAMLDLYVQRAGIQDGQTIIDLGCGWGSVTLYMAARFRKARLVSISNSKTQKEYILRKAKELGLNNVEVHTLNVAGSTFAKSLTDILPKGADRVISIEMFEHMKNYGTLLKALNSVLKPGGKLFVHIFTSRFFPWHFETDGLNAWMTKHFFLGGTMPSSHLLSHFQDHLTLEKQWAVNGQHYQRTLEAWLAIIDSNTPEIVNVFQQAKDVTEEHAKLKLRRWRLFMYSCAEFFAYRGGTEFFVSHYLFNKAH